MLRVRNLSSAIGLTSTLLAAGLVGACSSEPSREGTSPTSTTTVPEPPPPLPAASTTLPAAAARSAPVG